jgi:enoyl-CoA hydratase/3-hydroxyacyl-CoA dehydrogenase
MTDPKSFERLAVVGAGMMGSGIAQKFATEGFPVVLVDLDEEKVRRGVEGIRKTLGEGVERRIFKPEQAERILSQIKGTSDWGALADVDLAVEAVFEDQRVKERVFERLEQVCRPDAVLATNTSSFSVTDLAAGLKHPERVVGLHFFFHPAKNRLVEVVPGARTNPDVLRRTWTFQEQTGKIPIASADSHGFIVNRYFAVWLNEAIRIAQEGSANLRTIEEAAKEAFGVGMGPFELMNVSGIPIAMHTCNTLKRSYGAFYSPAELLKQQIESGKLWDLAGEPDRARFQAVADRMLGGVLLAAAELVDEGVGTVDDVDLGARVGLRWPKGPFELANGIGTSAALELARRVAEPWKRALPRTLAERARTARPFEFALVRTTVADGVATLTLNRPDSLNALNEAVMMQLAEAFHSAAKDPQVGGIVIAGRGKAFIAGADIKFFIRNIEERRLDRTVEFTKRCQDLLREIDECSKPVVARLHGLALGGGFELALACDHIVASEKAAVGFPETGIGIYPGLGGTQRTTRRVGVGLAKYLVFTGQTLSAKDAAAVGLVDRVVAPDALDAAVLEAIGRGTVANRKPAPVPDAFAARAAFFATARSDALLANGADETEDAVLRDAIKRVRRKAPIALRIAGELIERGADMSIADAVALELDHLTEIFSSRDAYAGLLSIGGPPPHFEGR